MSNHPDGVARHLGLTPEAEAEALRHVPQAEKLFDRYYRFLRNADATQEAFERAQLAFERACQYCWDHDLDHNDFIV